MVKPWEEYYNFKHFNLYKHHNSRSKPAGTGFAREQVWPD